MSKQEKNKTQTGYNQKEATQKGYQDPSRSVSSKVFDILQKKHINPKPKWHFLAKNCSIWSIFTALMLVGSLSVSVMIFILTDSDWNIYQNLERSPLEHAILSLPYFWILLIFGLFGIAFYNYKHTKKGYKHHIYTIILGNIALSFMIGAGFHYAGLGAKLNDIFSQKIPLYHHMIPQRKINWANPEKGLLAGKIISIDTPSNIIIIDFSQHQWSVNTAETLMHEILDLRQGINVRMIGSQTGTSTFQAIRIRPWHDGMEANFPKRPPDRLKNLRDQVNQPQR